uniref:Uncharacterized protein n=1 Tax=Arundo donax TaxID=35708 RepID=A0A0A9GN56_ARUDO
MNSSGMNNAFPIKGTTQIRAVGPGPANPSGGNLPIPNMPSWAKWVVGAVVVAVPIYRRMRTLEGKPRSYMNPLLATRCSKVW